MKAPDKIYLYHEQPKDYFDEDWHELPASDVENTCYIRKDLVDETVETAEDHAYFAGKEKMRQELLNWLRKVKADPMMSINIDKIIEKIE